MIFLLGGPPRVGKSEVSDEIRHKHAVSVVSTDTLGAVLETVLDPQVAPDLFVFSLFNALPMAERVELITKDPSKLIDYVRKESHVRRLCPPGAAPQLFRQVGELIRVIMLSSDDFIA